MNPEQSTLFVKLLAEHERKLQHYVRVLIPNSDAADDVLQESKLAMWQHFEKFDAGSNFNAWAHRFVFNRVLAWRKKKGRDNDRVIFTDEFYEMLDEKYTAQAERIELKIETLKGCISKLEYEQRSMLKLRYFDRREIEQVASAAGKTVTAAYRALSRIRVALRECVSRNLTSEL